jgi:hypothetical protein
LLGPGLQRERNGRGGGGSRTTLDDLALLPTLQKFWEENAQFIKQQRIRILADLWFQGMPDVVLLIIKESRRTKHRKSTKLGNLIYRTAPTQLQVERAAERLAAEHRSQERDKEPSR